MKNFRIYIALACLVFSTSCSWFSNQNNEEVVARVGDYYLYLSELEALVDGETGDDSLRIVQVFIDNWIKERLLIQKAELNLNEEQLDFEKQLENYRNSLIIYAYENKLVKQKLDTHVTQAEINSYYEVNQGDFELKEPLYQARYIDFLNSAPNQDSLKVWFTSKQYFNDYKLNDFCTRFARLCELDSTSWIPESNWKEILPLDTNGNYKTILLGFNTYADSSRTVWIRVSKKLNEGTNAPVEFIQSQIKSIILNRRRLKLIADVKQEIYEEATIKQKYEIF